MHASMRKVIAIALLLGALVASTLKAQHTASGTLTVVPPNPVIKVSGNHFVNGAGQTIVPRGVDIRSGDFQPSDTTFQQDGITPASLLTWHVNIVRLLLDEDCWLGINGSTNCRGGAYKSATISFINSATAAGIYVIPALAFVAPGTCTSGAQRFNLPDADHAPAFWTDVATTFKSNQGIMFDLFTEPHGIVDNTAGWTLWRDGGSTSGLAYCNGGASYNTAGVQSLVNTVRATGATTQPIILDGLNYAQVFDQWLTFKPTDSSNSIVAGFHIYSNYGCNQACWTGRLALGNLLTAGQLIFTGEVGDTTCTTPAAFLDNYMSWADSKNIGYTVWSWYVRPCNGPTIVSDYNGTPLDSGVDLRNHLLAIQ